MYASVEKLSGYITRGVYTVSGPFHPFGGAVDIIVVQQQDGSFKSSPWYVRFGKFQGVLKTKEKVVTIAVNGDDADFHMYLDHKGEAYFLRDVADEGGSVGDSESPPSTSGDETDEKNSKSQISKTQSCHIDGGDVAVIGDQVVVARRRPGIFGLFGRRSMKEDHTGVHRVSSLERAEIAADLLETKWSTNLPTADPRGESKGEHFEEVSGEHFEEVSVHGSPSEEIRDVSSPDGNAMGEEDLRSSVISKVHIEERIMESEGGRRLEEVIEVTTLDNGDLGESGLIYETVMTESKEFEVSLEGPILTNATYNVKSHGSSPKSVDSEQAFHESFDASVVEKGGKEVFTLSYCVPAESTNVEFSLSTDNREESLNLPFCPSEQIDHGDKVSSETSDLISEVKSQPESSQHEDEDVGACGQLSLEISATKDAVRNQANWPSNEAFEDAITNDVSYATPIIGSEDKMIGSCSSYNSNLISSKSEVANHEEETLNSADGKEPSLEPIVLHGNQPQMNESGSVQPQHPDNSEFPDYSDQVQEITNLEKGFEGESSCLPDGYGFAQKADIPDGYGFAQKADNTSCSVETIKARVPSSENSDDDQFLFGDFDGIEAKGANTKQSLHDLAVKADVDTLFNSEGDAEECETKSVHDEQSRENIYEVSRAQTSPMAIPRSQAESDFVIRSLPIIRSHIHELGPSNHLHPLSCSLNMNSDRNEHGLHDHTSESSTPEVDSKTNMLLGRHISTSAPDLDPEKWGDQRGAPVNPAVELSLCRHLLFEGMGADSASQAFDAEKVNLEKFSALRSSIVTNKRLVVRIGDRYFPWDAAAPIILGMISFGQGEIFEPQGMIAVDQPGNILKGDAMGEMVPSGGSWRLWPFTFRKSKTITTVRSTREGIIVADVDTTPESTKNYTGNAEAPKAKTAKKKEQTLIPTSEELASLNLKEGPNVITFTFSTAMLGRQQVDARIFLWKWNTRIVISDVDGTITKSDVLGQFMPMVGIDWSQTGVAHLFSAIKENGYQLLFLSARAISQAYITRQFLFNLKQDGKALPDGPVVISPDGLFPSLYREVIRRAPHEFKISCLEDIKALFPSDCSPFYAGFGNRDTDEVSYLKVGIPKGKIFIINPKGQVAVNRRVATKSYTSLHALVNGMFPPMSSAEQEDFNSWNYWKLPLPDIDV